ncbi:DUF1345 domain-containing protein, partial [Pseudomonas syringae pv. tagetis]
MGLLARNRRRLSFAALGGLTAGIGWALLIPHATLTQSLLTGWDTGVWLYLILIFVRTVRSNADDVRRVAMVED